MDSSGTDDYELMPKDELDTLRKEVSTLKRNSVNDGDKIRILIESMDRLTVSMNRLITILDDAQRDIIDEYQASKPNEKLNQLVDQNELIARAIVALSDNFTNLNSKTGVSMPQQSNVNNLNNSNVNSGSTLPIQRPLSQDNRNNPYGAINNMNNNTLASGLINGTNTNMNANVANVNTTPNAVNTMNNMPTNNFNNAANNNPLGNMNALPPMNSGVNSFNNMNNGVNNNAAANMNTFNTLNNANRPSSNNANGFGNNPFDSAPMPFDDLPPMGALPSLNEPVPQAPKKKFLGIM